jgi:hypothetical protein
MKKNLTDQIVFISSKNYLNKIYEDMKAGKLNIFTKLERKMLSDIRDWKKKNHGRDILEMEIKELNRT